MNHARLHFYLKSSAKAVAQMRRQNMIFSFVIYCGELRKDPTPRASRVLPTPDLTSASRTDRWSTIVLTLGLTTKLPLVLIFTYLF